MSKINIVFFNAPKNLPLIGELFNYYQAQKDFEAAIIDGASEVAQVLSMSGNGIVIFKIENKPDLQAAVTLLKSQKKLLKKGTLKVACLSFVKSKKVEKILAKYGCQEILDPKTTTSKTFSFKVNFWSKNIRAQIKEEEKDLAFKQRNAKDSSKEAAGASAKKEDFVSCEALALQSDIWISKHKNDHKRILKRYLSRMLGPSPHLGKWLELEPQPGDRMPTWKFVLKDPEAQLVMEDGAWYFSGSKPEFDWKINRWNFSSERPHLYFYTQDGKAFSRLKFNNGHVLIADNSTYALTKEDYIVSTCDSTFSFEGDSSAEGSENLKGEDAEGEVDSHYEGESNTENLQDKLRGKGSTDILEDDNHQNDSKYKEDDLGGNLEGKSSTDELDMDPLSGELSPGALKEAAEKKESGYREEAIEGKLGGKSSTDHIDEAPLSGGVRHGEVTDEEDGKKSKYQEEEIETNYGGKSHTDELDRDPLSGELTANPGDESKNKESTYSEDPIEAHYGGKAKTDKIDSPELEGKLNPGALKEQDEKARNKSSEEDLGGHYGGASATDELDRDPLSGELSPKARDEEPGKKNSQFHEDDLGGKSGGKSKTDELDRDPLSGELTAPSQLKEQDQDPSNESDVNEHTGEAPKRSAHEEATSGALSGKLSPGQIKEEEAKKSNHKEDDLGGHYDSSAKTDELDRDPISAELTSQPGEAKKSSKSSLEEDDLGGHYGGQLKKHDDSLDSHPDEAPGALSDIEELERELDSDLMPRAGKLKEEAPVSAGYEDAIARSAPRFTPEDPRKSKEDEIAEALGGALTSDSNVHDQELRNKVVHASKAPAGPKVDLSKLIGEATSISTESGDVKVIVRTSSDSGDEVNHICIFEDFFPDELVVKMPSHTLKSGDSVKAMARLQYAGQKLVVEANGVVDDIEDMEEGFESVIIAIDAIDEDLYDKFMGLYQQRQENIHEFMKQAKGIE